MSDWKTVTIGSRVWIERGFAFRSSDYSSDGHFVLRVTNLSGNGRVDKDDAVFLDRQKVSLYPSFQLNEGDILLVMVGATTGKIGKVSADVLPALLNQNIWNLKPATEDLSKPFFYYSLHDIIDHFLSSSQGSARDFLKQSDFKNIRFLLPPLPQQKKIARILTTLDNLIEKTESLIAKYQAVKQGMMHDLFTRGVDAHGKLRPPQSEAPELYKQSELGWIPKEWEVEPLVNRVAFPQGQVDPRQHPYRDWTLVAPDHIEQRTGRLISSQTAAEQGAISGKYEFVAGDVVYSKIRPYLRKAILALGPGICSADMYPLRALTKLKSRYLLGIILGEHFSRFAEAVSSRSGFPKINRSEFSEYDAAFPDLTEQELICNIVETHEIQTEREQQFLSKCRQIKVGLMHDLLTGKVRVKLDQSEEAAAHS